MLPDPHRTSQTETHCGNCYFDVEGGVPSASAAAKIKFGLEAVPGVFGVHFQGEAVEVAIDSAVTDAERLRTALIHLGFNGVVAVRGDQDLQATA
jgi:copper chaperone CopZ